jgi:hypothetical protein
MTRELQRGKTSNGDLDREQETIDAGVAQQP